jgi:hypothetical protein
MGQGARESFGRIDPKKKGRATIISAKIGMLK